MELMMDVAALGGFMYEREEKGIMLQSPSKSGRKFFDQSLVSITIISAFAIAFAVSFGYLYVCTSQFKTTPNPFLKYLKALYASIQKVEARDAKIMRIQSV